MNKAAEQAIFKGFVDRVMERLDKDQPDELLQGQGIFDQGKRDQQVRQSNGRINGNSIVDHVKKTG